MRYLLHWGAWKSSGSSETTDGIYDAIMASAYIVNDISQATEGRHNGVVADTYEVN